MRPPGPGIETSVVKRDQSALSAKSNSSLAHQNRFTPLTETVDEIF
jgi:hypothetical protein